ncbi:hypothetical protein GCM10027261_04850 [Geodermatophilus arenarius]|uniref:Peptidoglycan-binding protein n=1 Tax=Geodermatophilus arenarius TaxID=1137990 RepID=A0ABV9LD72_9ACTN
MRIIRLLLTALAAITMALLTPAAPATADTSRSFPGCPVLHEGDPSGTCVERLQHSLNAVNDGYDLDADGQFGSATRIAVLDFQGRNHLGADGIVGASTADELERQALQRASVDTPSPGPELTPSERCRLIGPGWIVLGEDRCVRDGVIPLGLDPLECAREEVALKQFEESLKIGYPIDVARQAAEDAVKKLSTVATVVSVFDCMFVDIDPETRQAYESVPMP